MTARIGSVGLVLVAAVLLQTTMFAHLTLSGFRPDLLLLATTAFAVHDGAPTGLRVGFVAGLMADLLLHGSAVGLTALVYLVVGYAIGLARPYLAADSITAPLFMAFAAGFLGTGGYGILAQLLGAEPLGLRFLVEVSLIVGAYNGLLAPVVVALISRLGRRYAVGSGRTAVVP